MHNVGHMTIEDVIRVSRGARVALRRDAEYVDRITRGAALVRRVLDENGTIYGVTTGYGASCVVTIPPDLVNELPAHLVRYHGCGGGAYFDDEATLATLAARLNALARGHSGVRWELLERQQRYAGDAIGHDERGPARRAKPCAVERSPERIGHRINLRNAGTASTKKNTAPDVIEQTFLGQFLLDQFKRFLKARSHDLPQMLEIDDSFGQTEIAGNCRSLAFERVIDECAAMFEFEFFCAT